MVTKKGRNYYIDVLVEKLSDCWIFSSDFDSRVADVFFHEQILYQKLLDDCYNYNSYLGSGISRLIWSGFIERVFVSFVNEPVERRLELLDSFSSKIKLSYHNGTQDLLVERNQKLEEENYYVYESTTSNLAKVKKLKLKDWLLRKLKSKSLFVYSKDEMDTVFSRFEGEYPNVWQRVH